MTLHAKFHFNEDFNAPVIEEELPVEPSFSEAELEAARSIAHDKGLNEGKAKAEAELNASINASIDKKLDDLLKACANVVKDLEEHREKIAEEAAKLAMTAAKILAPTLVEREPEGELMAMFDKCVSQIQSQPHVVVKVGAEEIEPIQQKLEERAKASGYGGNIVALRDDVMIKGDCSIEWSEGGLNRNSGMNIKAIEEIIRQHFPTIDDKADVDDITVPTDQEERSAQDASA